jgi:hypothetical protein
LLRIGGAADRDQHNTSGAIRKLLCSSWSAKSVQGALFDRLRKFIID